MKFIINYVFLCTRLQASELPVPAVYCVFCICLSKAHLENLYINVVKFYIPDLSERHLQIHLVVVDCTHPSVVDPHLQLV